MSIQKWCNSHNYYSVHYWTRFKNAMHNYEFMPSPQIHIKLISKGWQQHVLGRNSQKRDICIDFPGKQMLEFSEWETREWLQMIRTVTANKCESSLDLWPTEKIILLCSPEMKNRSFTCSTELQSKDLWMRNKNDSLYHAKYFTSCSWINVGSARWKWNHDCGGLLSLQVPSIANLITCLPIT